MTKINLKRRCREITCRKSFDTGRVDKEFCGDECRRVNQNRRLTRGMKLYPLAMKWRRARNSRSKGGLAATTNAAMGRLLDEYIAADKEIEVKIDG